MTLNEKDVWIKKILSEPLFFQNTFLDLDFHNTFMNFENPFIKCISRFCTVFSFPKCIFCILDLLFENKILIFELYFLNSGFTFPK